MVIITDFKDISLFPGFVQKHLMDKLSSIIKLKK